MARHKSVLYSEVNMVNIFTILAVGLVSGFVGYLLGQASVLARF